MALFTQECTATPPPIDTEDSCIDEIPGSGKGKRRSTPFDILRKSQISLLPVDDDDLIDEFIIYNEELGSTPFCSHRVQVSSKKEKKCRCLGVLSESVFFCEAVG
jgi:hypothetical protein